MDDLQVIMGLWSLAFKSVIEDDVADISVATLNWYQRSEVFQHMLPFRSDRLSLKNFYF